MIAGDSRVSDMKRIGVFGGSFDPIHVGHLIVAEILLHRLDLERVLFLPAGRPPHKPEQELAADHHRLRMLQKAINGYSRFEVCTVDLDRPGSSYTATTLEILNDMLGNDIEIYFLMGQDSLRDFPAWHQPDRIATLARLGVALRPNVDVSLDVIEAKVPETAGRITLVEVPLIDLSSRDIRGRVSAGDAYRFQVPSGVANYIDSNRLYLYDGGVAGR